MRTLETVLQKNRGIGPGFDHLRLGLSLAVLFWHSFQLSYGTAFTVRALHGPAGPLAYFILPAFFALSGFLVAGSMVRLNSIKTFALFRALRIAPALATEITLSALILGPLVTVLPLGDYFTDGKLAIYFTNIVGFVIHFHLPGVFLGNPVPETVNGSLWTVPSELHCYILLILLMALGIASKKRLLLAAFIVLAGAESAIGLSPHRHYTAAVFDTQEMLVLSFICGNVFYLWRDHIPFDARLFGVAVLGHFVIAFYVPILGFLLAIPCLTYATIYLGMVRFPRVPVLMGGDYSYGIYLYGFPIQQTLVWAFPPLRAAALLFLAATPLTVIVAMGSWRFIEKPTLGLRKRFSAKRAAPPLPGAVPVAIERVE